MKVLDAITTFLTKLVAIFDSHGGEMALALMIYFSSLHLVRGGLVDLGKEVMFMALGAIFQSSRSSRQPKEDKPNG